MRTNNHRTNIYFMKKRIRLLFTFSIIAILLINETKAQNIENGNFCIGNNAGQHENCWYFDQGNVPNWFRSHGTPQWESSTTGGIRLHHSGVSFPTDRGEGIVGSYYFKSGLTYTIEIGLLNQISGALNIKATSGINEGPLIFHECTNNASIVSPSQIEHIHSASLINSSSGTVITTTYTASINNDQIWIYFSGFTGASPASFLIDYVKIWVCETGSKHYPVHIDPNFTRKETISTGTGSLPISNNLGNSATTFIGTNIHLNSITAITATNNDFFLAVAVNQCTGGNDDDQSVCPPIDTTRSKPGRPTSTKGINIKNRTFIHPNPSSGSFTIQTPQSGNYTIRVMNLVGSTVYEGKMEGEQKKSIQLDSGLPPGNYTIHINGDGLRHIEKLVITK